jgi:hypothetical protein
MQPRFAVFPSKLDSLHRSTRKSAGTAIESAASVNLKPWREGFLTHFFGDGDDNEFEDDSTRNWADRGDCYRYEAGVNPGRLNATSFCLHLQRQRIPRCPSFYFLCTSFAYPKIVNLRRKARHFALHRFRSSARRRISPISKGF